jgi:ketosteroid isomerase-like protein
MNEEHIWEFINKHLTAIFSGDWDTYKATTSPELSLYEWWVLPHRQDGIDFHQFMIQNMWMGRVKTWRFDLFEKRCQIYGDTAVVTYTFMLSQATDEGINHRSHNETRVLIKQGESYQVVHVHKSPCK